MVVVRELAGGLFKAVLALSVAMGALYGWVYDFVGVRTAATGWFTDLLLAHVG